MPKKRKYSAEREAAVRGRSHDDNPRMSRHDMKESRYGANGPDHEVRVERGGMKMAMRPNNPGGSFMREDWGAPALTPRGVHEITVDASTRNHKSGRLGDLYEQVDRTMRADQAAFDSITDPVNW